MFIDSVVWIALKYKRDQWHQEAVKLKNRILILEKIHVTDFIIVETYNFLSRKVSWMAAQETLGMFLESQKVVILYNNFLTLTHSKKILEKYNHLSLTDANLVWFSENLNINEILSFDKGFDNVSGIKRISS
ncbi:MAG: type II toxin-antitoxin system VapC family toxin [Promethearchaeota archaeon]